MKIKTAMRGVFLLGLFLLLASTSGTAKEIQRPKILGIAGVEIISSNMPRAREFYLAALISGGDCSWCVPIPWDEQALTSPFIFLPAGQSIEISAAASTPPSNLLKGITFWIEDEVQMKRYLDMNHIHFKELHGPYKEVGPYLSVVDPEGHALYFVARKGDPAHFGGSPRTIHAGFVVRDRGAMDKFYRDILGFKLYWTGGMKDAETDWVDMQVPDGTDWIEYMLNVPADADKRTLGVMNHIALGVPDVRKAAEQLEKAHVEMRVDEPAKIGKDGKWQLNLYDPDGTRVELMEFTPVEKPCCAEYTGNHPKP